MHFNMFKHTPTHLGHEDDEDHPEADEDDLGDKEEAAEGEELSHPCMVKEHRNGRPCVRDG